MKFGHSPAPADSRKSNYHLLQANVCVNLLCLNRNKSVVRLTDRLDMTIAVKWDFKPNKPVCTPIFSYGYSFQYLTVYMCRGM